MSRGRTIVGIDIGTTKIAALIAEDHPDGGLRILGVGVVPSEGLRRGMVVNLEQASLSISKAIEEAELMAGLPVRLVLAGIAGDHIRSLNSRGIIGISRPGGEIGKGDVKRVLEAAGAVAIPLDREILHVIPQSFTVDDQRGVRDPVGMVGVRLEAEVHIVTGAVTSAQNIVKAIRRAGYGVEDLVLEPLAASYGVLTPDERELGVIIIDIGGGTTDLAIHFDGAIRHTSVIGLGGDHVTKDIAIGLRTPVREAVRLKEQYGSAVYHEGAFEPAEVEVPGIAAHGPRRVGRDVLTSIIRPRMEEILGLAQREVRRMGFADLLGAGVVLTGGAANLHGAGELAEQIFQMPARIACPKDVRGVEDAFADPRFACGVGLILYGQDHQADRGLFTGHENGLWGRVRERMGEWIADFF